MSAKQPEPMQFEFDFGDKDRYRITCVYQCSADSHVTAFALGRAAAMALCAYEAANQIEQQTEPAPVFSFAERIARRRQAHDDMLYESILARIKHLPF